MYKNYKWEFDDQALSSTMYSTDKVNEEQILQN